MIEIKQNSIVIRDASDETGISKLKKRYSTYDRVSHKYTMPIYYEYNDSIFIPKSVGVTNITSLLPDEEVVDYPNSAAKYTKITMSMINPPRDDLQRAAIEFLKKLRKNPDQHELFLALATGKGKTYVSISTIAYFKMRTIVMVDTLSLADQWKNSMLKHSDLTEDDIGIISGQDSLDKECKLSNKKVYIGLLRTFTNAIEHNPDSVNDAMRKLKIGLRVFDEAHTNFQAICFILALSDVDSNLFLTATPSRSAFTENAVYGRVFGKIPMFNGKSIDDEPYHTVLMHKMNSFPNTGTQVYVKTKYGFSLQRWAKYLIKNAYNLYFEDLDGLFVNLKLIEQNKKVAIMLPTIELIDKTAESLKEAHPDIDLGKFIGSLKTQQERDDALSHQVILTNDKIFGKAIDVPGLQVLINYVQVSSNVNTEQILGRLRKIENDVMLLIDITDHGFPELIRWMKKRRTFYRKKAKRLLEESD